MEALAKQREMPRPSWRTAAIVLAVLLALSWLPGLRYSFKVAGGDMYRLDRITGGVVFISGGEASVVDMPGFLAAMGW